MSLINVLKKGKVSLIIRKDYEKIGHEFLRNYDSKLLRGDKKRLSPAKEKASRKIPRSLFFVCFVMKRFKNKRTVPKPMLMLNQNDLHSSLLPKHLRSRLQNAPRRRCSRKPLQ